MVYLPYRLFSLLSFLFFTQNKGGHPGPFPKIRYWTGGRSSAQYCKAAGTGFPSRETSKAGSRYRTEDIAAASSLRLKFVSMMHLRNKMVLYGGTERPTMLVIEGLMSAFLAGCGRSHAVPLYQSVQYFLKSPLISSR